MDIYISGVSYNPSLNDGPGYRTVVFFQGCDLKCRGCHNKDIWKLKEGRKVSVFDLEKEIRKICFNKKLTISGGEPLMQKKSLEKLLEALKDFDICLYTGHDLEDVSKKILKYLKYIKVGCYIEEQKTTTKPFVGSENQILMEVKNGKAIHSI